MQSFGTNLSGISIQGAGTLSLRNDSSVSFTNGTSAYNIANSASGATINVDRVTGIGTNTITVGNLTTTSTAVTWQLNFTGANGVGLNAGALTTPTAAAGSHTISNNISGGGALTLSSVAGGGTGAAATLIFGGAGNTTVSGAITQAATAQALTKNGAGTLLLNGTSSCTGMTTVNAGTLGGTGTITGSVTVLAAGSLAPGASAGTLSIGGGLTVTAMATGGTGKLKYELDTIAASDKLAVTGTLIIGSDVLGFSDFNFTALGGLQNGTYKLITSGGITGTLDPIPANLTGTIGAGTGTLQITGNDLELVVSGVGSDPYATWSGGAAFNADANNDGVKNGLAWLLGAANKDVNATGLLPSVSESAGKLIMTFDCLSAANRGTALLNLQYSKDLGLTDLWSSHTALVPGTAPVTTTVNSVTFNTTVNGALIHVVAEIPASAASPGTKLFGRLNAETTP